MKLKKIYVWLNYLICLSLTLNLIMFSWRSPSISLDPIPMSATNTATTTELRGVWLTNVASNVFYKPWAINRSLKSLANLNFNTVYPVVWNRGYTFYPSQVAEAITGSHQAPRLKLMRGGADLLQEIIQQAHQAKMSVIPWFEYGLIVPSQSQIAKRYPHWLTQNQNGQAKIQQQQLELELNLPKNPNLFLRFRQYLGNYFLPQQVWLNPFHPDVQNFLKQLILEVVNNYDLDGIQIDDHFGMPVEMGYDSYTIWLYQQEHHGKKPPSDPHEPEWMSWRAEKITNFWANIVHEIRKAKPEIRISLSPNSQVFSYQNYLQNWQTWVKLGLVDELILQVYRDDISSFREELADPALELARSYLPVSVGIFTGNANHPVSIEQIKAQIEIIRDRNFAGISFFYWESLWGYITPESPRQRRRQFQSIFAAPAKPPNLAAINQLSSYAYYR